MKWISYSSILHSHFLIPVFEKINDPFLSAKAGFTMATATEHTTGEDKDIKIIFNWVHCTVSAGSLAKLPTNDNFSNRQRPAL